jgi:hypothetical protein
MSMLLFVFGKATYSLCARIEAGFGTEADHRNLRHNLLVERDSQGNGFGGMGKRGVLELQRDMKSSSYVFEPGKQQTSLKTKAVLDRRRVIRSTFLIFEIENYEAIEISAHM